MLKLLDQQELPPTLGKEGDMTEASSQRKNVVAVNRMDFKGIEADPWCVGILRSTWNTLDYK